MKPIEKTYLRITEIDTNIINNKIKIEAILPDSEPGAEEWLELNREMSEIWPNISEKKDPPSDHEKYRDEQDKFEKYFKENI